MITDVTGFITCGCAATASRCPAGLVHDIDRRPVGRSALDSRARSGRAEPRDAMPHQSSFRWVRVTDRGADPVERLVRPGSPRSGGKWAPGMSWAGHSQVTSEGEKTVRVIETGEAPAHTGPVPQAVEAGGWIFVSALFGADPRTGAIPADARIEAELL